MACHLIILFLPCALQDYVRLLKYGDSLYRCKQLKRAALVCLGLVEQAMCRKAHPWH